MPALKKLDAKLIITELLTLSFGKYLENHAGVELQINPSKKKTPEAINTPLPNHPKVPRYDSESFFLMLAILLIYFFISQYSNTH